MRYINHTPCNMYRIFPFGGLKTPKKESMALEFPHFNCSKVLHPMAMLAKTLMICKKRSSLPSFAILPSEKFEVIQPNKLAHWPLFVCGVYPNLLSKICVEHRTVLPWLLGAEGRTSWGRRHSSSAARGTAMGKHLITYPGPHCQTSLASMSLGGDQNRRKILIWSWWLEGCDHLISSHKKH